MNKDISDGKKPHTSKFKSYTLHIKYIEKGELKKIHELHCERLQNGSYGKEERRI